MSNIKEEAERLAYECYPTYIDEMRDEDMSLVRRLAFINGYMKASQRLEELEKQLERCNSDQLITESQLNEVVKKSDRLFHIANSLAVKGEGDLAVKIHQIFSYIQSFKTEEE